MLKLNITNLDEVSTELQALYTENDNGTFDLSVETGVTVDTSGLKRNNQDLKSEKLKLQEKLNEITGQLNQKTEDELLEKGNYEELLATKAKEFEEKLALSAETATKATTLYKDSILNSEVQKIATELAGDNAMLITPHLRDRISVNDNNEIVFSDINGNASHLTTESIIKEFRDNDIYKPLTQRVSSGAGASGSETTNQTTDVERYFNPQHADYSPTKQGDIQETDPEVYKSLSTKFGLDNPFAQASQRVYSPQNNMGDGVNFRGQ